MRFKQYLVEMPMQLNLVGNNWSNLTQQVKYGNNAGNFDNASAKMLASDKAKAKIVRRMQNVPYDFNVYFVQTKNKASTTKVNKPMMQYMYPQLGITPEEAPIVDGKINIFVTSWQLDPPTSWMIIHRFAHSDAEFATQIQQLLATAGKQLSRPQDDYGIVSGFGTMKSAVNNNLGAADEPSHEIITQYIMTGKVTFDVGRKMWANQRDNAVLKQLEMQLNQTIKTHMQDATNYVYFVF